MKAKYRQSKEAENKTGLHEEKANENHVEMEKWVTGAEKTLVLQGKQTRRHYEAA